MSSMSGSDSDYEASTDASDMEDEERLQKARRILGQFESGRLKLKGEATVPGSQYCPWCSGKKPHKSFNSLLGHAASEARCRPFLGLFRDTALIFGSVISRLFKCTRSK